MWLHFSNDFSIEVSEKNKLIGIKVMNAMSNTIEDFIEFAAILRNFLNRNEIDEEKLAFLNEISHITRITYTLNFKTKSHDNKRYLIVEVLDSCFQDALSDPEDYDMEENNFEKQTKQITTLTAQKWLEALNKFPISVSEQDRKKNE